MDMATTNIQANITLKVKGANYEEDKVWIEFNIDTNKMHESYIQKALEYGVRRWLNDSANKASGEVKGDYIKGMIKDMCSGEAYVPARREGIAKDPIKDHAIKTARSVLNAMLKLATGKTKAIDFANHDKGRRFFSISEDGKATWIAKEVQAFVDHMKDSGKRDFMQEAKEALAVADDAASYLDF